VSLLWIVGWVLAMRLVEVVVSDRHRRALLARGGREFFPASYQRIALMHGLFIAALVVESFPWVVALDLLSYACLAVLAGLQVGRWWCMAALGENWNVRIIVVPGEGRKLTGPYRWIRHPNYLVVVLELIFLPLLMRAFITLAVFSIANLLLLRQRIRLEEMALADDTAAGTSVRPR
jgi:methyltransferase